MDCTMETWLKGPNQQQNGTSSFISSTTSQGFTSTDWYDHEPLVAGDRDPMKRSSTDPTTYGDKKMLFYSHRRQCAVAAPSWKNA